MLRVLWQSYRGKIISVAVGHIITALLGLFLIAIVHQALFVSFANEPEAELAVWLRQYDVFIYAALLPLLFAISVVSYRQLANLGANVLSNMRQNLVAAILALPYEQQEALGGPHIRALLTLDLDKIGDAFRALPMLMFNIALMACCLLYMLWLSPLYFCFYFATLVFAGLSARWLISRSNTLLNQHRECEGNLQQHFSAIVTGARELTLNKERRNHYQHHIIQAATEKAKQSMIASESHISIMVNWVTLLIFVILGILLLLSESPWAASQDVLAGYVIMTLFIRGPVLNISSQLPILARGNVAWEQILSAGLASHIALEPKVSNALSNPAQPPSSLNSFNAMTLKNVVYNYQAETVDERGFKLGPINLEINKGELLFIVGGNGSGKSTLAKLLCGLYSPTSGELCINHQPAKRLEQLNEHVSAIFFDFHLFQHLLDENGQAAPDETINYWLSMLKMENKVTVKNGMLSNVALSQGQRKRLALVIACCENRPILLLDEWAADQDPYFRKIFYEELLPLLKAQGKTVVAITHDDRYFAVADRVFKLESGELKQYYLKDEHYSTPARTALR